MRFNRLLLTLLALLPLSLSAQLFPNLGGQRAGISALTFLKIGVSPRAEAMGGATVANPGDAYSLQWNPAAITDLEGTGFAASNTFWMAGLHNSYFSVAKPFKKMGTFGLNVQSLTTGEMERRTETQPDGTGEYFSAYNVAVGLSYARQLTNMFSFGVNAKYVNETLAEFVAHTAVVDLGFTYRLDWKDFRFAVMLQSFGPNSELTARRGETGMHNGQTVETESYPSPTVFSLGFSLAPIDNGTHRLFTSAQLNHPNDNAENVRIGVEYSYDKFLFARAGYKINVDDQPYPTFGAGIRTRIGRHPLHIDYSAMFSDWLGYRQRVGLALVINNASREDTSPTESPIENVAE